MLYIYITVYESFWKWCTPVQLWDGSLWGCGGARSPSVFIKTMAYIHHHYSNWCTQHDSPRPICHIAGNFCEVQIFAIFATHDQNAEPRNTKLRKFEHVNFWKFLSRAFSALVLLDLTSDDGTIALFQTDRQRPTLSHGTSFVLR